MKNEIKLFLGMILVFLCLSFTAHSIELGFFRFSNLVFNAKLVFTFMLHTGLIIPFIAGVYLSITSFTKK